MKEQNDGKQMTDVWRMPEIVHWKKLETSIQYKSLCASLFEWFMYRPR